jgi:Lrp/AsnC family transcriptional regulator, leucine-responsive regulatory protein
MDAKDKLLIQLLERDGRAPILTLARAINLSRSATQARMARLVKDGFIKNFTITMGEGSATRVSAHLLIKLELGKTCAMVVPNLRKIMAINSIHSIAGPYDVLVRLEAADVNDLEQSRASIAAVKGIHEATTLMVLEKHMN